MNDKTEISIECTLPEISQKIKGRLEKLEKDENGDYTACFRVWSHHVVITRLGADEIILIAERYRL